MRRTSKEHLLQVYIFFGLKLRQIPLDGVGLTEFSADEFLDMAGSGLRSRSPTKLEGLGSFDLKYENSGYFKGED